MLREKIFGFFILLLAVLIPILFVYLIFFTEEEISILTLKLTVTMLVMVGAFALAWIGYVLATTPPPNKIEKGRETENY